jgi:hypothetical protein
VPVTRFGISNKTSTTSPTDKARRELKQTPVVEMFNARVCSLSDSDILRLKDNEVCSLKRGVLRRSVDTGLQSHCAAPGSIQKCTVAGFVMGSISYYVTLIHGEAGRGNLDALHKADTRQRLAGNFTCTKQDAPPAGKNCMVQAGGTSPWFAFAVTAKRVTNLLHRGMAYP